MKNFRYLSIVLVIMLATLACSINFGNNQIVEGSGVLSRETRSVNEFTAIELAGSGDVTVRAGETQSVQVEADDNIVPLIETNVQGSKLVISTKPNVSMRTKQPIRITVTVKSLDAASITGSGNMTISNINAGKATVGLSGSGNITVAGTAQSVQATLNGSGNILCSDLIAQSATVRITGSGNVTVNVSQSLDANITGSGNIKYRGSPAKVNQSVSGSGSINSIP
jgi:hypothetical protein